MLLEKKIYHFYHSYADGENSVLAFKEHLDNLISSNLSKHLEKFYVGIIGSDANRETIKELFFSAASEIPLEIVVESTDGFEQVTLEKMHEHAKSQHGYYFYAHSKSAANASSFNECWMYTMEYYNLVNWTEVVQHLKSNDAAGCYWLTHEGYPDLIHWYHTNHDTNSFFAGNYWWTTSEVIRELPLPDKSNRYMAEQWIGKKQNLKVYDLHPGLPKHKNLNCSKYGLSCHCTRKKYIKKIRYVFLYIGFLYGIYSLLEKL
jgi:hypothetical protein